MRLIAICCFLICSCALLHAADRPRVLALVDAGGMGIRGSMGWIDVLSDLRPDCDFSVLQGWHMMPWDQRQFPTKKDPQRMHTFLE